MPLHYSIMAPRRQKKNEWPCGTCNRECKSACLLCEGCDNWFHIRCEKITAEQLKAFSDIPESYICIRCRSDGDAFDYLHGLTRLSRVSLIYNIILLTEMYCPYELYPGETYDTIPGPGTLEDSFHVTPFSITCAISKVDNRTSCFLS